MKVYPPSFSYETAFSSYREEWEQLHKRSEVEDVNILDLKWWKPPHSDNGATGFYLIACTDAGEVVLWNMEKEMEQFQEEEDAVTGEQLGKDGPKYLVTDKSVYLIAPMKRIKVSNLPLRKIKIFQHDVDGSATEVTENEMSRKRKRPLVDDDENVNSFIIFVAGVDSIWSLPWNQIVTVTSDDVAMKNMEKMLDHDHILDIQTHQQRLFVLTSNRLFVKDVSISTAKWLELSLSSHLKNHRQHPMRRESSQETCTSFLISDFGSSATNLLLLVGTNLSRILLLRLEINDISGTLSLVEKPTTLDWSPTGALSGGSPPNSVNNLTATGQPWRFGEPAKVGGGSNIQQTMTAWTITGIIETHNTWWTVSAKANDMTNSDNACGRKVGSMGRIATWHAPSKALVASCETPEAVASISSLLDDCRGDTAKFTNDANGTNMHLCSVANHRVVTLWRSPYVLERSGRLWTTSPSNKAVAKITHTFPHGPATMMAVAGVGNAIDVYIDNCRARTLTIS